MQNLNLTKKHCSNKKW